LKELGLRDSTVLLERSIGKDHKAIWLVFFHFASVHYSHQEMQFHAFWMKSPLHLKTKFYFPSVDRVPKAVYETIRMVY